MSDYSGRYAFANPEQIMKPKTSFSISSEFDLIGKYSCLSGNKTTEFPDIEDAPKAAKKKKTSGWWVAGFVVATIVVGAIAVITAPVSAAVVIGCMVAFAATAATINVATQVISDGWDNVDWGQVIISGCCGAMSAAFAMISFEAVGIGAEMYGEVKGFNFIVQGLFNGGLGVAQTASSNGDIWQMIDSFLLCGLAGGAGGSGYAYKPIETLKFAPSLLVKDMIFNGLLRGYVFGNTGTIIGYTATKDNEPLSKRAYEFIKSLFNHEDSDVLSIN